MEFSALSDAELVKLSRGGSAPAFAVLVHRHGPAVRALVSNDEDPVGAVISTYVAAMRHLDTEPADPAQVRGWLLRLASEQVREPVAVGGAPLPALDEDELDEIWAELDLRWPDGRVPRHVPAWLGWTALVVAIVSLGVLVPYVALTWGNGDRDASIDEVLRAEPYAHEDFLGEDDEVELEQTEVEDLEFELPPIDFGDPGTQTTADPEPTQPADPPPPPPPASEEPDPDPEPEVDDEPDGSDGDTTAEGTDTDTEGDATEEEGEPPDPDPDPEGEGTEPEPDPDPEP